MTLRKKIGRQKSFEPSESAIVNSCLRWLWHHGCFVWRNNSGAYKPENSVRYIRYGRTGSADLIGMTPDGRFLACECKSAKGKLTPQQIAFRADVLLHKGVYILARGIDDLEACKEEIVGAV